VRFAKTGDPNGSDLPVWPPYEGTREPYMAFDFGLVAGEGNRTAQLDMIRDYCLRQSAARP
jgi:hypothetical protein